MRSPERLTELLDSSERQISSLIVDRDNLRNELARRLNLDTEKNFGLGLVAGISFALIIWLARFA